MKKSTLDDILTAIGGPIPKDERSCTVLVEIARAAIECSAYFNHTFPCDVMSNYKYHRCTCGHSDLVAAVAKLEQLR